MKLALHRSITFWAGLLSMAFICGCWHDSRRHYANLVYHHLQLCHAGNGVMINWSNTDYGPLRMERTQSRIWIKPEVLNPDRISWYWLADWEPSPLTPAPLLETEGDGIRTFTPYWLPFLAVALLWSILLLWRVKRWLASPLD